MRKLIVIVMAAIGLGSGARAALAQDAAAEVLFQDGDRLMREGKLAEACDAFEASNRIEPRTGTLIRLGDCREKRGQLASAWSAYADASARAKDPAKKQVADAKVAALGPRLSKLTITVAQPVAELAITRDGAPIDRALWGRAVPVDGGDLVLRATALGFQPWEQTVAVPVEGGAVTVDVPRLELIAARDWRDVPGIPAWAADFEKTISDILTRCRTADELDSAGKPRFSKTNFTGPLFIDGAKPEDVQQGQIGDCYFPAAMAAIAKQNPDAVNNMVKDNGDGTYTVTFKQKDWSTGRFKDVAIKVVRDLHSAEQVARFERERALLARLEHPGIARVLDGGSTDTSRRDIRCPCGNSAIFPMNTGSAPEHSHVPLARPGQGIGRTGAGSGFRDRARAPVRHRDRPVVGG